ncbi:MAG: UDP-N-acetylmuramoyl-L-alanyl-D-glutamate--2,6-diaminopimelate ligase [Kiritimatiellae bacterium]|nr:UDP-N-acetylmuramoyl-L-alanyl-D-glutamate--2,6-diaminopimelate ligase [Kiritimatiellia bacterium]
MDWPTFIRQLSARTPLLSAPPGGPAIAGLCYDSRQARPGDLFFALPGARDDGTRFVPDALARGAVAVLFQDGAAAPLHLPADVPAIRASDARGAMAAAAAVFYGDPTRDLRVCGITGTNGKTTTAFMLRRLLEASGTPCALVGTVRYEWAGHSVPASRTTPEAPDLQRIFAEALAAGQRAAAMEVSSQGLCARRLEGVRFAAAVFTNLTPEHLDYHRGMEQYYAAKRLLFESLAAQPAPAAPAILNADDPYGRRLAAEPCLAGLPRIRFSLDPAATPTTAEVRAAAVRCTPDATAFRLLTPWGDADIRLPLIGRYNVANALAAAAAACALGAPPAALADAFAGMPGVPGRLERVPDPAGGRHLFVDYAHTPDALENLLRTLRELAVPPARLWCVFGCGGDRDPTKRPVMGRIAADLADAVVLTSDNPRNEPPDAILREISAGMGARAPVLADPDRPSAIRAALRLARPGDIVVVAGKGHETYQEGPSARRTPMDDRALLRDALRSTPVSA